MPKLIRNRTPAYHANLTRRGEYDNGGISHSSKKRILTHGRIGFNIDDRDELWISYRGGLTLKGSQVWDVQLNDDDDFYLDLEVRSEDEARSIYLNAPMVIDWQWITGMGFKW